MCRVLSFKCKVSFTDRRDNCLHNRVEELRKARGMNQEDFAKALQVSRQTISSIENGKYNPSLELAFIISRFFGMPIEEIFLFEGGNKL